MLELNFYCDTYGIDTISFGTALAFAMECYENGVIDKDKTGGIDRSDAPRGHIRRSDIGVQLAARSAVSGPVCPRTWA